MKSLEIKASLRKNTGKQESAAARRQGIVPCVMYGGKDIIHFGVTENELRHLLYTPHVYLVNLNVDGKKYNAILKEAQFHPVSDKAIHLDFVEVAEDKPCTVLLPISLSGNSIGLKAGGKLRQRKRNLKVSGLIKDIPETLDIDITKLRIGGVIKVAQLKFKNLTILDSPQVMVVGVVASRIAKGGAEEVEEEEETAVDSAAEETEAAE
jgi:large subunit ribosomal protein L25